MMAGLAAQHRRKVFYKRPRPVEVLSGSDLSRRVLKTAQLFA